MGGDTASGAEVMRFARQAEEVGFDSVWLVDHFCYSAAGRARSPRGERATGAGGPHLRSLGVHGHRRGTGSRDAAGGDRDPGGEHRDTATLRCSRGWPTPSTS